MVYFRIYLLLIFTLSVTNVFADFSSKISILNDSDSSENQFQSAVNDWPSNEILWNHLTSNFSRERFARLIIEMDRPKKYHKEKDFPYTCTHFARERVLTYGMEVSDGTSGTNSVYQFTRALKKFQIPMREAGSYSTAKSDPNHAINAVFLGDENAEIQDPKNWLFFEPQTNEILYRGSVLSLWSKLLGTQEVIVIQPPNVGEFAILDKRIILAAHRICTPDGYQNFPSFIVTPDRKLISMPLPILDGTASLAPHLVSLDIVLRDKAALRRIIVGQASLAAKNNILNNILSIGTWKPVDIAEIKRWIAKSEELRLKYGKDDPKLHYKLTEVSEPLYFRAMILEYHDKPWVNEWMTFLKSENLAREFDIPDLIKCATDLVNLINSQHSI